MFRNKEYQPHEITHISTVACTVADKNMKELESIKKTIYASREKKAIILRDNKSSVCLGFWSDFTIGNQILDALADVVSNSNTLEAITIHDTWYNAKGVAALCNALKTNTSVQTLSLSKMILVQDTQAISAIVELFQHNKTITQFSLKETFIGHSDWGPGLAQIIKSSSLTALDCANNRYGGGGFKPFIQALKYYSTLQYLDIRGENLTKNEIHELIDALNHNQSLLTLHLPRIMSLNDMKSFSKFLDNNKTLTILTFEVPAYFMYKQDYLTIKRIKYELFLHDIYQKLNRNTVLKYVEYGEFDNEIANYFSLLPAEMREYVSRFIYHSATHKQKKPYTAQPDSDDKHIVDLERLKPYLENDHSYIQTIVQESFDFAIDFMQRGLMTFFGMQTLHFEYTTVKMIDELAAAMSANKILDTIDIFDQVYPSNLRQNPHSFTLPDEDRQLGDYILQSLSNILKANKRIKTIKIRNDWYTLCGLVTFLASTQNASSLHLSLINCPYLGQGIISDWISTCSGITSLELCGNQSEEAFEETLNIIHKKTAIKSLTLREFGMGRKNDPRNEKLKRLALVLAKNKTLALIDLDVHVTDDLSPLFTVIYKNTSRVKIRLLDDGKGSKFERDLYDYIQHGRGTGYDHRIFKEKNPLITPQFDTSAIEKKITLSKT